MESLTMPRFSIPLGLVAASVAFVAGSSAHAANTQSWLSSTGSGTACTRAAPCNNFITAQTATLPGGVISVLDGGELPTL